MKVLGIGRFTTKGAPVDVVVCFKRFSLDRLFGQLVEFELEAATFETIEGSRVGEVCRELGMVAALVKVGFAKSNGEARRLIRGGGARLNDVAISDEEHQLGIADFIDGRAKISAGKKRHALLVLS